MRGSGGGLVTFVAFLTFPAIATPLGGGPRPVTKIEAQVGQDVQFGCPSSLKTTHQVEWYKVSSVQFVMHGATKCACCAQLCAKCPYH